MSKADERNPYCDCLYYSANALARVLGSMADEAFAVTGLGPSYAFLLMTVNGSPGIQPSEISEHMQLAPSTVTRLIEKLEHRGYLERRPAGRSTHVFPTKSSKELDPALRAAWAGLYRRYSDLLGEKHAAILTQSVSEATRKLTS
jgi:DNA-binding MarR family transcriptional regulator